MSCTVFDENKILLYAYGELEGDEAEILKSHLPVCAECRAALEEIESLRRLVKDNGMPAAPGAASVERLRDAARSRAGRPGLLDRLGLRGFPALPRLALAAAAVIAVLVAGYVFFQEPGGDMIVYDSETLDQMMADLDEEGDLIVGLSDEYEGPDMLAALSDMDAEYSEFSLNGAADEGIDALWEEWEELEEEFELLDEYFKTL